MNWRQYGIKRRTENIARVNESASIKKLNPLKYSVPIGKCFNTSKFRCIHFPLFNIKQQMSQEYLILFLCTIIPPDFGEMRGYPRNTPGNCCPAKLPRPPLAPSPP